MEFPDEIPGVTTKLIADATYAVNWWLQEMGEENTKCVLPSPFNSDKKAILMAVRAILGVALAESMRNNGIQGIRTSDCVAGFGLCDGTAIITDIAAR